MSINESPFGTYVGTRAAAMAANEKAEVVANLAELKKKIMGSAAEGGIPDANMIPPSIRTLIDEEIDALSEVYK